MNDLAQLHADLLYAAGQGAQSAGESAVHAGADHESSSTHALLNIETVNVAYTGPLEANVTASQPPGITSRGPVLPDPAGTADVMADAAAEAGLKAIGGKRE